MVKMTRQGLALSFRHFSVLTLLLSSAYVGLSQTGHLHACDVCRCDIAEKLVDCSNANLTTLPTGIPVNVSKLDLSHNNISRMPDDFANRFYQLQKLDLDRNNLSSEFRLPKLLVALSVEYNSLKSVDAFFTECENLQAAYLASNRIDAIRKGTFLKCSKLTNLDISYNPIATMPPGSFTGLKAINELYIRHSPVCCNMNLTEDIFDGVRSELQKLTVQKNHYRSIGPGTFGSFKRLETLALTSVVVGEPLQGLFLPVNGQVVRRLIFTSSLVNLTHNTFTGIDRIYLLHMNKMKLQSLPSGIFSELSIDYMLDLSSNKLSNVADYFLSSSPNLAKLYMGHNGLTVINNNTFAGLYSLRELYLYQNNIHTIHGQPFLYTNLIRLFLYYNNITSVDYDYFSTYYRTIEEIHLYYNGIVTISRTAFSHLAQNASVYMNSGKLSRVPHIGQDDVNILFIDDRFNTSLEVNDLEMLRNFETSGFDCHPTSQGMSLVTGGPVRSHCMPCSKGYYGGDGTSVGCKACPPGGFFQNETGQTSATPQEVKCKYCNNGTYVTEHRYPGKHPEDCEVCPTGTYKDRHAGYRACYCLDNYFRRNRFGPCEPCPSEGVDCFHEHQRLMNGYWWSWDWGNKTEATVNLQAYEGFVRNVRIHNFSYQFETLKFDGKLPKAYRCPLNSSCVNDESDIIKATCDVGYEGWLCTECSANYYSWFQYCFQCPQLWQFILEMSVILVVVSLVLMLALWHYRSRQQQSRSLIDIIFARFKIVLGFYQVSGAIFSSLHDVSWPSHLSGLGNVLQVLELNILQLVAKPHCFFPRLKFNAYDEFVIGISFIVLVLVSASVGYVCVLCYLKIRKVSQNELWYRMRECRKKCYMYVLLLLFITYPSVCNVTLSLLPPGCDTFCLDETGAYCVRKLRTDYSIDCSTNEHQIYTYAAYVALIYVIGFPVLLLLLLYVHSRGKENTPVNSETDGVDKSKDILKNKNNSVDLFREPDDDECLNISTGAYDFCSVYDDPLLDISTFRRTNSSSSTTGDQSFPLWLRFLCENYRHDFWYWEILELLRKILQTALVVLYGSADPWYLTVTIAISVTFLTSHAYFKPMKDDFEHRLQMSSLAAIFLNLLVAMVLMMPSKQQSTAAEALMTTVLLVLLNVVVVVLVAVNIIMRVLKSVRGRSKKKSNSIVEGTLECLSITAALFGYMAAIFSRPVNVRASEESQSLRQRTHNNDNDDQNELGI